MTRDESDIRHEEVVARLSEHLDGLLPAGEARRVEEHLAGCDACRTVARELDAVRSAARSLVDAPPERDLWPGVRDSLHGASVIPLTGSGAGTEPAPGVRRRRGLFLTVPQLAAAATVLIALGGAAVWLTGAGAPAPGPGDAPPVVAADATSRGELAVRTAAVDREIATSYAAEVERLEALLEDAGSRLDPSTVRVLEKNLTIIDRAIAESLDALDADPGNPWVRDHLRRSWERKVTYLQETADFLSTDAAD